MKTALVVLTAFLILLSAAPITAEASVLATELPPPPTGVDNFIVAYMLEPYDKYVLGSTEYTGDIYIKNDVLADKNGKMIMFGDRYELIDGEWKLYAVGNGWSAWYDSAEQTGKNGGKVVIFSSSDVYGSEGQLLSSKATDGVLKNGLTLVGDKISSSLILAAVFRQVKSAALVAAGLLVFVIAFYKAWSFVKSQLRGV